MRTHLDLFSGIGGFALAAGWAGYTTIGFCEIDPFCHQVLRKHWPEVPIHADIRTLTADVVGQRVDLLTGGFPCQSFSVAGQRRGKDDDRWLWPEMARVIDECRPRWVLGENVDGFINMALDDCLADLESIGYEAWAVVLPACGVGAWHRRNRVWIIAHSCSERKWGNSGSASGNETSNAWRSAEHDHIVAGVRKSGIVAHSCIARRGRPSGESGFAALTHEVTPDAETCESFKSPERDGREGIGRRNTDSTGYTETRSVRGFTNGRSTQPGVRGMDDGLPNWAHGGLTEPPTGLATGIPNRAARLKALGNSIVPQVAYEIIRFMEI